MPTPAERKALLFFSGLMVLGSGVRASSALSGAERAPDAVGGQPALEHQIAAVDTAQSRRSAPKKPRSAKGSSRGKKSASASTTARAAGPSPSPRNAVSQSGGDPQTTVFYVSTKPGQVDLDVADAGALERLPRIGPVMAARIVANRDSLGPFGSLEELQRVKGVGPALARVLSPYVTFSLRPRPSRVKEPAGRATHQGAQRHPRSHR
jgi:DNA uptake protein ComE-like DNA-binding protein